MTQFFPLSEHEVHQVCKELCEGVDGAKATHPRLARDVQNAYYVAMHSRAFRAIIRDIVELPLHAKETER